MRGWGYREEEVEPLHRCLGVGDDGDELAVDHRPRHLVRRRARSGGGSVRRRGRRTRGRRTRGRRRRGRRRGRRRRMRRGTGCGVPG